MSTSVPVVSVSSSTASTSPVSSFNNNQPTNQPTNQSINQFIHSMFHKIADRIVQIISFLTKFTFHFSDLSSIYYVGLGWMRLAACFRLVEILSLTGRAGSGASGVFRFY